MKRPPAELLTLYRKTAPHGLAERNGRDILPCASAFPTGPRRRTMWIRAWRQFCGLLVPTFLANLPVTRSAIDLAAQPSVPCRVRTLTDASRLRVADDITKLVGNTPLLQLKRVVPSGAADIFAKLEYLNPGGSVKDRAAIGIIRQAEEQGKLKPGGTIVEATAGNTGIGLALIGVNRGYKVA